MKKIFSVILVLSMAITLAACSSQSATTSKGSKDANSVNYPTKSITMIVPWSAGGGTDTIARKLVENAQKDLGVSIVIENDAGGSGSVGLAKLKAAKPDGYTLAVLPVELSFLKNEGIYPFDFSDFTPICGINSDPAALTVAADSPFKTVKDLVDYAKANPSKVKIGHSGTGFLWHLAAAEFAQKAGIKVTYVPFDGSATANAALMGNQITAVTVSAAEEYALTKAGKLRVLATMSDERMKLFKDCPTMKEAGYDISLSTFRGIGGPKGMDSKVVTVLQNAFKKMTEEPSFTNSMNSLSYGVTYYNEEDYRSLCNNYSEGLALICNSLGLSKTTSKVS